VDAPQEAIPQDRLTDYTRSLAEIYRIAKPARQILSLNKSIEENPRQANLFKQRAQAYDRLENYEQAIADYSSALKIQPDDVNALHLRGLTYEQLGQPDRAVEDYQRAIAIDPQLSNVYLNRGVAFGKMGNYRQSIASLTEAIRLAPQNPDGYFNRGITYFQLGDLNSAIEDFSNVIRILPKDEDAYYWRGISYEEGGNPDQAIPDYEQFLALSQNAGARNEIEQRLSQLDRHRQDTTGRPNTVPEERQTTDQHLDLYELITSLGERAANSTWFGSEVECYGEKADELYSFTQHSRPIEGRHLLDIASGIHQTIEGDFEAFDSGANSYWIFIRAWHGSGFYIEINESKTRERLKTQFPSVEEVQDVQPPYEGLFIHI
jgi:tetratricopeptide (TPR) repeat protein